MFLKMLLQEPELKISDSGHSGPRRMKVTGNLITF